MISLHHCNITLVIVLPEPIDSMTRIARIPELYVPMPIATLRCRGWPTSLEILLIELKRAGKLKQDSTTTEMSSISHNEVHSQVPTPGHDEQTSNNNHPHISHNGSASI